MVLLTVSRTCDRKIAQPECPRPSLQDGQWLDPPALLFLSKKKLFARFALLSVDEINPEPTSCPQPCGNPGCLQCQASLINNLDGVSAFSQTNNFI